MASRSGRTRRALLFLVLVSVTLLTLDLRNVAAFEAAKSSIGGWLTPLVDGIGRTVQPVGDLWAGITGYDELRLENEALRAELEALRGQELTNLNSTVVLEQLLAELEITYLGGLPRVVTRVIRNTGNFPGFTVDVDKGSESGVAVGMPAVTNAGLVGRVIEVGPFRSRIRLITDLDFELGVRLAGSDVVAIARGTGHGQPLVITDGVPASLPIVEGSLIITSGVDRSVYPPDIPVGVVSEIRSGSSLDQVLSLEPSASLEVLDFVTIIQYESGF